MQGLPNDDWPGQDIVIFATRSESTVGPRALGRDMGLFNDLIPHFHFETLPPNLLIIAIINIHAGVNAVKMPRRSVPNG
jgi:hypothetical protein